MGPDNPRLPPGDARPRREFAEAFGGGDVASSEALGLDDAELIDEYLGGNPAAYGEFVRRHQIPLFRLLLGLLADEDLAEEACEQVFLMAERRLAELEDRSACYQWLLGIARDVSIKLNERGAFDETRPPESGAPLDHLKREVHALLQQLSPDLRLVLVLVELRGAPESDVAAALGCPLTEVPGLVAEARADFAKLLAVRASRSSGSFSATSRERKADTPHLHAGAIVGERYRIKSSLAAGGMGVVYLAIRLSDGLEVALKTLLPGVVTDETSLRRFDREIEAIERVAHENFVAVLDHGRSDDMPYLVMEYLRGRPLAALVQAGTPFEPVRALRLVRGVLCGLAHAHGVGVIHRDLKLDNIFVLDPATADGVCIKVLDLGLAKLLFDDESTANTMLTERGAIFGTPSYMAPEQALGEEVDLRADLYSIAVILYQLLAGGLPFESANPAALLVMHVSIAPPPVALRAPHLAGCGMQLLLDRGLAKARADRYASAEEFISEIDRLLARPLPSPGDEPPERALSGPLESTVEQLAPGMGGGAGAKGGAQAGSTRVARGGGLPWLWLALGLVTVVLILVVKLIVLSEAH